MLMKDSIPFVTLRALYLIETLENSPLSSSQVSLKQLNLLLRLILQRLASSTNKAVLKPLCSVLATLCLREPLRKMAINKIIQKLDKLYEHTLSLLTLIYFLGVEAVQSIFLPNLDRFLENIRGCDDPDIIYITKGIYGQICRANLNDTHIQTRFVYSISKGLSLGDEIMVLWKPFRRKGVVETKDEINFVPMKTQLIKTRRKVDVEIRRGVLKPRLEDVFEIPLKNCKVKKAVEDHRKGLKSHKKETRVIVGKTTLLFSVLKSNDRKMKNGCCDHSLLGYNL
ncbi:unnamed protein product [Acanthoscelides obtectus]|uniref:Uncharacterized protein n=1 Tax=Acanthoscelides obtectus TaxID=200917 RepID=A0A9P0LN27_ACAOB|nr:unnamed protein product [Acanthoscelides obtectus]CAK1632205.1 hypothetical protein AOBTE_LOCUS7408 [Acanthoscelides obtectus]